MKNRTSISLATAILASVWTASAGITTTTNPSGTTEIGTRIRWGATGFEASIFDQLPTLNQNPTLNPGGTPVWQLNSAYKFHITFDSVTGALGLEVDFDRSGSFGAGESVSRSVFNGTTSYAGLGFNYLTISGNESGSTARSTVGNLVINGSSQSSISPNGSFVESFYKDSSGNPITSLDITGELTFSTSGTSQERPSWNFNLQNATTPVPEPSTYFAAALLLVPVLAQIRRSSRSK